MNNQQKLRLSQSGLKYLLYLPNEYTKEKKFPVLLFLHGSGERGNDTELVKKHGPPKLIEEGKEFPFIIISPQCPRGLNWTPKPLNELINEVVYEFNGDENRIYVTGISMGGYATWALAIAFPDEFAAVAPICGGGDTKLVNRIKKLPIWAFHGAKDDIVPISESEEMVSELQKIKGDIRFTVYEDADHDSWTRTYNNQELYDWLLKHKRKQEPRKII
jgi:predicted peptidase